MAEPHLIANYEYDAIFIDPPFANITPIQIATCLQLMGINNNKSEVGNQNKVHLYVAYNSRREKKLLEAMDILCVPKLVRKWRLSYKEGVSEGTQDSIWLYGPE